jgi:hypothetical protein
MTFSESKGITSDRNLIMACHISGVFDVNRNETLNDDNYELVREWAESIADQKLNGIIFHNNFSTETCLKHENEFISFIRVNYNPAFNPNVFRYFVYRDFLELNMQRFDNLFVTDVSDVTLMKNPFTDPFFTENPSALFCGDEPKILNNEWMNDHSTHLRKNIPVYADYEQTFAEATLLNCGIIGANAPLFFEFIQQLCDIHERGNRENKTAFTGDMGAFNYLVRTKFNENLKHGTPVNTVFKGYEDDRQDCWFKHK